MIIGRPTVTRSSDGYRHTVDVSGRELWYEAPHPMRDTADAAAVALLIPAMVAGTDVVVRGRMSARLAFNLGGPVQDILIGVTPSLKRVAFTVEPAGTTDTAESSIEPTGVATGFSAGVDSFSVLADHLFGATPTVTHLLFNNVGSHRLGEPMWRERMAAVGPAAERLDLPLIGVNSNLPDFYQVGDEPDEARAFAMGLGFQKTHTMRNASVPLLLGFSTFLYASTYKYEDCRVAEAKDLAYVDPLLLPLLSTETQTLRSVGCQYSRVDKTLQVAQLEESYRSLDICADGKSAGNCSVCWKCKRTQLTLELAGMLDRYDAVFDRSAWERVRPRYVLEVLGSSDPLLREIADFGAERGAFGQGDRAKAKARAVAKRLLRR